MFVFYHATCKLQFPDLCCFIIVRKSKPEIAGFF